MTDISKGIIAESERTRNIRYFTKTVFLGFKNIEKTYAIRSLSHNEKKRYRNERLLGLKNKIGVVIGFNSRFLKVLR